VPNVTSPGATQATEEIIDNDMKIVATIVGCQPDASYPEGLAALADVVVLQMFDSEVGETLGMAYTIVQEHQERHNRRAMFSAATEALREHLARLDQTLDDP
jgi:hypothetical protein